MSLLPDLGRLALCPTSGTNDSEAGPSQPIEMLGLQAALDRN